MILRDQDICVVGGTAHQHQNRKQPDLVKTLHDLSLPERGVQGGWQSCFQFAHPHSYPDY